MLALLLNVSAAIAGAKVEAETAAAENSYALPFLFGRMTDIRPVAVGNGRWAILVPSRPEVGILVDADFSSTCLMLANTGENVLAFAGSDAMNARFLAFSKGSQGQCAALVWSRENTAFALVTARVADRVSAVLLLASDLQIEVRQIDPAIDELANPHLSADVVWLLLNRPTPLGEIKRLGFHPGSGGRPELVKILEVRDGVSFLRVLQADGVEQIFPVCDGFMKEQRWSAASQKAREVLKALSENELHAELVPFVATSRRTLDVSAYLLCMEG
ncbi:MAG: hypothetical protein AB7I50_17425 [Vicinamibacterales bacterium]